MALSILSTGVVLAVGHDSSQHVYDGTSTGVGLGDVGPQKLLAEGCHDKIGNVPGMAARLWW
jgi:hypothetical protein